MSSNDRRSQQELDFKLRERFAHFHEGDPSGSEDRIEDSVKMRSSSRGGSRLHRTVSSPRSSSPSPPPVDNINMGTIERSETGSRRDSGNVARRRSGVSAECTSAEDAALFEPKVIIKRRDVRDRIAHALHKSPLFKSLDKEQIQTVIDAVEEVRYASGDVIIKQGDSGDRFYLLEEGTCEVWIKDLGVNEEAKLVKIYTAGDSFGDLALLYDAPRAATIKAISNCVLWAVDRITFRLIVMSTTKQKRELYENFLQDVPLLKTLDKYERAAIADVLEAEYFKEGEDIIVEGEPGDKMYFLEHGEAEATSNGNTVMEYKRGDYFGELALLNDKPRAASVAAVTACKCASIDRESFKRLLGKVEEIMNRKRCIYGRFKDDDEHPNWD